MSSWRSLDATQGDARALLFSSLAFLYAVSALIRLPQDGIVPSFSYRAAFLNGIAWNLLNMAIALWLLLGPLSPRAVPA